MATDALPSPSALASTLALWALLILSVVLLTRVLPIPESPFFLGASLAIVYWLVRVYTATDED